MAKKNRKITETDKAWYHIGLLEGEQRLKQTIILLRKTNNALWDELLRLDRIEPVVGIVLSFSETKRFIKALKKTNPRYQHYVKKLQDKLKKARIKGKLEKEQKE